MPRYPESQCLSAAAKRQLLNHGDGVVSGAAGELPGVDSLYEPHRHILRQLPPQSVCNLRHPCNQLQISTTAVSQQIYRLEMVPECVLLQGL